MVFVELLEVGGNDGDGKGEDEDPGHGAHAPEELAKPRGGGDVSVPHGRHGHHHPVDPGRYGGQAWGGSDLDEVGEGGKDEAADGDEEDEEAELLHAVLQGVGDGL